MKQIRLSEKDFQKQIVELAEIYGWQIHAELPAQRQSGNWVTPIQGHKGFPDLVLAKGKRLIFAELKSDKGKTSQEQNIWLLLLKQTGAEVYLWKPLNWPEIQEILTR